MNATESDSASDPWFRFSILVAAETRAGSLLSISYLSSISVYLWLNSLEFSSRSFPYFI